MLRRCLNSLCGGRLSLESPFYPLSSHGGGADVGENDRGAADGSILTRQVDRHADQRPVTGPLPELRIVLSRRALTVRQANLRYHFVGVERARPDIQEEFLGCD